MTTLGRLAAPEVPDALIASYDVAGPRYTSYPTVPVWSTTFGAEAYAIALREAGRDQHPLALYAHFPYCSAKCHYCGCNALVTQKRATVERYLDDLQRELDLVVAHLGAGRRAVQLHWGGGTPNVMTDVQIRRAFHLFADRFDLAREAELSVEADPRHVTPSQLETLRALGFDRISFGVQDLDPAVQEAIGRVQSEGMVREVVDWSRAAGFTGINIDLIYGLPRQTVESFTRTMETALALDPDRVATFGYAHMPSQRAHQRLIHDDDLPSPATRAALFQLAVATFTGAGYAWLGLDHFAKGADPLAAAQRDGVLHRNFMGYTTMPGQHLIGVGMSAISEVAGRFAQNAPGIAAWREAVTAGRFPTVRGHRLSDDDLLRQRAIMHLMCNGELPYELAPMPAAETRRVYTRFADDGLVTLESNRILVTPLGRFFLRNLCMELDAHLTRETAGRFSRTV